MSQTLPAVYLELAAASGLEATRQNVEAVMQRISTLPDAVWGRLSPDAQIWFNNAADKIQGGQRYEDLLPPEELRGPGPQGAVQEEPTVSPVTPVAPEVPSSPSEPAPAAQEAQAPASPSRPLPQVTSPGRGRRPNKGSTTEVLRRFVVANLEASPAQIEEMLHQAGVSPLPASNTIITILYEARKIIAIYKEIHQETNVQ